MELTQKRPATELPETKIPLWERLSQLVEVTGTQRLEEHEPSLRSSRSIVAQLRFSDL
jgi:hypothetical protein